MRARLDVSDHIARARSLLAEPEPPARSLNALAAAGLMAASAVLMAWMMVLGG
ncbi:MAG: hypothetical protein ACK4Z5_00570 [Brevundimonas sp.]